MDLEKELIENERLRNSVYLKLVELDGIIRFLKSKIEEEQKSDE